jgi:microcystin-dependent protein
MIIRKHSSTSMTGWVKMSDGTIGSASSGATLNAASLCLNLYIKLWDSISDTYCPVTGGRGVSAIADFSNNKPIALPRVAGRVVGVAGAQSGYTTRSIGEYVGTQTHTVTEDEGRLQAHFHDIDAHTHTGSFDIWGFGSHSDPNDWDNEGQWYGGTDSTNFLDQAEFSSAATTRSISAEGSNILNTSTEGSNASAAHTNIQPTNYYSYFIKL